MMKSPPPSSSTNNKNYTSPYYSTVSFGLFGPVAVLYSLVSRIVFTILPLPKSNTIIPTKALLSSSASTITGKEQNQQSSTVPSSKSAMIRGNARIRRSQQRVAVVTGSNTGIGYETARVLVCEYGYEVVMACRSRDKATKAIESINAECANMMKHGTDASSSGKAVFVHPLDLSSIESITSFSRALTAEYQDIGIDVLVNNAGRNTNGENVAHPKMDLLFTSNFLGHYILTSQLMKLLLKTNTNWNKQQRQQQASPVRGRYDADDDRAISSTKLPRVVNLSSVMHHFVGSGMGGAGDGGGGTGIDSVEYWKACASSDTEPRDTYSPSKLASILFSIALNRKYEGQIQSIAVNPGAVNSDIWRDFPRIFIPIFRLLYLTPEQGCRPVVVAATQDEWDDACIEAIRISNNPSGGVEDDDGSSVDMDFPLYLQPYWIPQLFASSSSSMSCCGGSAFPPFEMMGPYVGAAAIRPRLPSDGGYAASEALWQACQQMSGSKWP